MKTMKELVTITVADPTAVHNNKKPDNSGAWHDLFHTNRMQKPKPGSHLNLPVWQRTQMKYSAVVFDFSPRLTFNDGV